MNPLAADGEIPDTGIPATVASGLTMTEQYDWHQSYLRRHRVSRRNFLRGSAAAAAVAALGVSPFGRRAYAEEAPLGVGNRHVGFGADASGQLRFGAQLSRNPVTAKVFVDHGPTARSGRHRGGRDPQPDHPDPASDGGVLAAEQFYVHAPVDGLPGRTAHFYRWRTSDGYVSEVLSASPAMPSCARRAAALPLHHDGRPGHRRNPHATGRL